MKEVKAARRRPARDLNQEVNGHSNAVDEDCPPFGITDPRAASKSLELSKDALRLYLVLASFADGKTRLARPGQDRLARLLGWTSTSDRPDRRRVYRALGELKAADLIEVAGTHSLGGGRWVRLYLVAPYRDDAHDAFASPTTGEPEDAHIVTASPVYTPTVDAHDSHDPMRTFFGLDAHVVDAPSYQSSFTPVLLHNAQRSLSRGGADEEEREPDLNRCQKNHGPSDACNEACYA
jgi:hypothetical protein